MSIYYMTPNRPDSSRVQALEDIDKPDEEGFGDGSNFSICGEPEKSPPTEQDLQNRFMLIPEEFAKKPRIHAITEDTAGIIAEMRCSFCKNIVPPPLCWACTLGHMICADCKSYIPYCPWEPRGSRDARNMCRKSFIRTELKFYDYVYLKSKFDCQYRIYGCPEKPLGREYKNHNEVCKFKPSVPE